MKMNNSVCLTNAEKELLLCLAANRAKEYVKHYKLVNEPMEPTIAKIKIEDNTIKMFLAYKNLPVQSSFYEMFYDGLLENLTIGKEYDLLELLQSD